MKKMIIFLFCMFFTVSVYAQLDSTIVNEALEDALDLDTGKWNQIDFADDTTQTTAFTGGGAPDDATFITQTPDGTLTNEQALSDSSTGIMRSATTTGVITTLTDSAGIAANISDETGTGLMVFDTSPTFQTDITAPLVIGGTGTTATLTYKTTTGIGATGARHIFEVGNDGATEAMTILNNGKVGIGTDSPEAVLQVSGTWVSSFGTCSLEGPAEGLVGIGFREDGVYKAAMIYRGGDSLFEFFTNNPEPIVFKTSGNNERMRIGSAGNVGIGTTDPANLLEVEASTAATGTIESVLKLSQITSDTPAVGFGVAIDFNLETTPGNEEIGARIAAKIKDEGAGTEEIELIYETMTGGVLAPKMVLTGDGKVGIGTTEPRARLEILDQSVLASESLQDGNFTSFTNWTEAGDMAEGTTNYVYTHSAGSGSLTQASGDLTIAGIGNRWYKLQYTISNVTETGILAATLTTAFAGTAVDLTVDSGGTKTHYFTSKASPGDFVISVASNTASDTFTIDDVTLKEITGGDVIVNGLITGGGSEGIKVVANGNVGMGVADPSHQLEVLGTGIKISFDGTDNTTLVTDTNGDLTITPSGTQVIVEGNLKLTNGNSLVLRNAPIGIHSHNANELNIESIGANGTVYIDATNDVIFRDENDNEKMRVETDTGNVIIGGGSARAALTMGDDKLISRDVNAGITASTTQSQGQGALTAEISEIAVVANPGDTVTLTPAVAGIDQTVINNGANTLQIFPESGDDLGAGVDVAQELEPNETVVYSAYDATNWTTVASTEIIHAHMADEDNTDAFVINDAGGDFHSYHTNGLIAGDLAGWTFDAGGAGVSFPIASIVDGAASGVDIEVTTTGSHLLAVDDIISQTNLANAAYVGIFEVKAIISATQYEVAAVFTATGTGTMDQAATLTANIGSAGQYFTAWDESGTSVNNETFDFQLMKGIASIFGTKARRKWGIAADFGGVGTSSIVSIADGDKISFAVSNEDSSANITARNFSLVLVRL